MSSASEDAIDIFSYALKTARVDLAMQERVQFTRDAMEVEGHRFALRDYKKCVLIALGKAASTMASSFLHRAGKAAERFEGVIVTPEPFEAPSWRFQVFCGGHPSPNAASILAAEAIL